MSRPGLQGRSPIHRGSGACVSLWLCMQRAISKNDRRGIRVNLTSADELFDLLTFEVVSARIEL